MLGACFVWGNAELLARRYGDVATRGSRHVAALTPSFQRAGRRPAPPPLGTGVAGPRGSHTPLG